MDQGWWHPDIPDWQREPMTMSARTERRDELHRATRAMEARRPGRKTLAAAHDAVRGYPKPFRRNPRKIGFR